jgi:hypothetical protein
MNELVGEFLVCHTCLTSLAGIDAVGIDILEPCSFEGLVLSGTCRYPNRNKPLLRLLHMYASAANSLLNN